MRFSGPARSSHRRPGFDRVSSACLQTGIHEVREAGPHSPSLGGIGFNTPPLLFILFYFLNWFMFH